MDFKNMEWITPYKELQDLTGVFDNRSARRYHIDLRSVMDDKTVLKNPHKGWFWHYVDNGFYDEHYRVGHEPEDVADFPGLKVLYIRFDWGDVEKEKGVYDFSIIDDIMDQWGKLGYTFTMRAVACEIGNPYATPRYVFEEGAKCYMVTGQGTYSDHTDNEVLQVDFADPIYLHYLEKFLEKFGEKYNNDPRVEYIDIGSYGVWGEGHTIETEERIYPVEVLKKHFDLHVKYFPDTFVLCNDDHIMGYVEKGAEQVYELFEYADARGLGLQDDSISIATYGKACGYDTIRAPWLFDRLHKNAPIALEYCHWSYIKQHGYPWYRDGFGVMEAMKNAHATFAGFHGFPKEWLPENRSLAEYAANRLGYWYFLTEAILPPMTNTAHNKITLTVENRGWAQAYHKYDMKILLRNAAGEQYILDVEEDNRKWFPGEVYTLEKIVDCRGIPAGEYDIGVGLFEGERPIEWALKNEICHEGFYLIGKTEVLEV